MLIKMERSNWPTKPLEVVLDGTHPHPFPWLPTIEGLTTAGTGVSAVSDAERGALSARDSVATADMLLWMGLTSFAASAIWFWVAL